MPYKLSYLPLFWDDLNEAVSYIARVLGNVRAAEDLIDKTEATILGRLEDPCGGAVYHGRKARSDQHYWIAVGNYMAFYVVKGEVMEVRRFLYGARDLTRMPL